MNLEKPDYPSYIARLSEVSGVAIQDFSDLKAALLKRMDYFASFGCRVSDHALEYVMSSPASEEEVDAILKKALAGETVTKPGR